MQENRKGNDVHAMLKNSTYWSHMLNDFLQEIFHGKILLQDLQNI